jgi:hypothetical protein
MFICEPSLVYIKFLCEDVYSGDQKFAVFVTSTRVHGVNTHSVAICSFGIEWAGKLITAFASCFGTRWAGIVVPPVS